MGPRQFKTCVYSSKPCDDNSGPGPPLAEKNEHLNHAIITALSSKTYRRNPIPWNCGGFIVNSAEF
jgi:hypothetical protein